MDPSDPGFYRDLLDALSDGVYLVDRDRRITYWSKGAERLTGYPADKVVGRRCRDGILNHVDGAGVQLCRTRCPLRDTMHDGQDRQARVYLRHRGGHRVPVSVRALPLCDAAGKITGAVETFTDDTMVTDLNDRLAELQRLALADPLTGLGNRRHLEQQLQIWMEHQNRYQWTFGLLFLDIDHFKTVNDRYGHDIGDDVLRMVAATLSHTVRAGDPVARYGGEEFVVVLPHADRVAVQESAERLRALIAQSRLVVDRRRVAVTVSIGATLVEPEDTAASVLSRADTLLYTAKRTGRNRVCLD